MVSESSPRAAWAHLTMLAARPGARHITALFATDPVRAARRTLRLADFTLDLSKTAIDDAALAGLHALARATGLEGFRTRLFAGAAVNSTEGRAAMHMALRAPGGVAMRAAVGAGQEDAGGLARAERERMRAFTDAVNTGSLRGATGESFTTVLNIGIGGSDLGPRMAVHALTMTAGSRMTVHFLSNVDGHAFAALAPRLDPARTLVLVASKTFTTTETMMNTAAARAWIAGALGDAAVATHFVALSRNAAATTAFGIAPEKMFGFRDWVGGRYSLWSAIGLPIAIAIGAQGFRDFLSGANAMDEHFRGAAFEQNLPVRLALLDVWYRNFHGFTSRGIAPYHSALRRWPAYLQQLEMESNGKRVDVDGSAQPYGTPPVLWGEPGTNGQHAYFQMLHQGTDVVPVEFVAVKKPQHDLPGHHAMLLANALAQAQALMLGKTDAGGHRHFPGNRPSTFLLLEELGPASLGALIALQEHRVFVSGSLWGINSYDQWGVELGKVLARDIEPRLQSGDTTGLDGSTAGLLHRLRMN